MKKSSLLSLLTAAAIVTTSAGTYALWDTMSATASGYSITVDKAITVNASKIDFSETPLTPDTPAEASINVTPTNFTGTGTIKLEKNATSLPTGVNVSFKDESDTPMPTNGFVVADATEKTYKVVVTINENEITTAEELAAVSGKQLGFDVIATLTK